MRIHLRRRGVPLAVSLVLVSLGPSSAAAEWFVGGFAGSTAGGLLDKTKAMSGVRGGYWLTDWVGGELRAAGVPRALEVDGMPDLVLRSSISTETFNLLIAPLGHRRSMAPYAAIGFGRIHTHEDVGTRSADNENLAVEIGGGVQGRLAGPVGWHVEARYERDTGTFIAGPGLAVPGPTFWGLTAGALVTFGR